MILNLIKRKLGISELEKIYKDFGYLVENIGDQNRRARIIEDNLLDLETIVKNISPDKYNKTLEDKISVLEKNKERNQTYLINKKDEQGLSLLVSSETMLRILRETQQKINNLRKKLVKEK